MKTTNSLVQRNAAQLASKQPFSTAILGGQLQNLIRKSVPDSTSAARFTGALISSVAATPQLQSCNPASVVAAALRGEGQGLTIGREYHLVPFGSNCAYVVSYKGLIALALATGDVADMDCIEVRDGEYVGRDKRTKRMKFDFSVYETDEESAKHPVIGYYAYCETVSGMFRYEYMSVADIIDHARRYSKSFDYDKYKKLENGKYSPEEAEKIRAASPWFGNFEVMAKKTVIRRLLNSGYVRLANSAALKEALASDSASEEGIIPNIDFTVDGDTGEVIDTPAPAPEIPAANSETDSAEGKQEKQPRGRKSKKAEEVEASDDDFTKGFFA